MAIIAGNYNNNLNNQQTNSSAAPTITGAPAPTTNAGVGNAPSGAPQTPQANSQGQGTSSGRFTNLNAYLNANKNYNKDQGGLAGKVYGSVENKANDVSNQVNQSQQQFNQQAQAGRNQLNSSFFQPQQAQPAQAQGTQQASAPTAPQLIDPTAIANDAAKSAAFASMRDNGYQGPQNLTNASQLQGAAQNIQGLATLGQSDTGRQTLLQQLYNTPGYSQGQRGLDNLLLQGNQQQLQKLSGLNSLAGNLSTSVSGATNAAQQAAANYAKEASDTKAATQNALVNSVLGLDTTAGQEAADAQKAYGQKYSDLLNKFQSGSIAQPELQQLGLNNNMELYGTDASKYLQAGTAQATKQNAITGAQQKQLDALNQLAGNALSPEAAQALSQYANNNQAGTFESNPAYNFQTDKFLNDVNAKKSEYEGLRKAQTNYLNEAQGTLNGDNGLYTERNSLQAALNALSNQNPNSFGGNTNFNPFGQDNSSSGSMGLSDSFQRNDLQNKLNVANERIGFEENKQKAAQTQLQKLLDTYKIGQGFSAPSALAAPVGKLNTNNGPR